MPRICNEGTPHNNAEQFTTQHPAKRKLQKANPTDFLSCGLVDVLEDVVHRLSSTCIYLPDWAQCKESKRCTIMK